MSDEPKRRTYVLEGGGWEPKCVSLPCDICLEGPENAVCRAAQAWRDMVRERDELAAQVDFIIVRNAPRMAAMDGALKKARELLERWMTVGRFVEEGERGCVEDTRAWLSASTIVPEAP